MRGLFAVVYFILATTVAAQNQVEETAPKYDLGNVCKPFPYNFSIQLEIKAIEKSLADYDPLIRSLEKANTDLRNDFAAYLKNPGDKLLAARITAKMSNYAKRIVFDIDKIISHQDILLSLFAETNYKLNNYSNYLEHKVHKLDNQVEQYRKNGKRLKKKLIYLGTKIKKIDNPQLKKQFIREFRKFFNRYNINVRYEQEVSKKKEDYTTLFKNLQSLLKMVSIVNKAFHKLLENLEAEKNYLLDNIRLQANQIQAQKLVDKGMSDGSRAVVKVTKKLAVLYAQVEGFAKVHEKINRDTAKFSDTSKILGALVNEISGGPFKSAPTIDKAIGYFDISRDKKEDEENEATDISSSTPNITPPTKNKTPKTIKIWKLKK